MLQPRLVQAVDRRDPLDPTLAPLRQPHLAGSALDKVSPLVAPAPCKGYLAPAKALQLLVGAITVADDDRVEDGLGEQLLRRLGTAARIYVESARLTGASAAGESPAGRRRQAITSTPSHGPPSARLGVKR